MTQSGSQPRGRSRLKAALSHVEGEIPIDLGSTPVSGAHVAVVHGLREHFGLHGWPVKIHEPYQMLGLIEDDLLQALGVDTTGVFPRNSMFGFPVDDWKEWRTPWGFVSLVPRAFRTTTEPNGDLLAYPDGDLSVPPSGRMPAGGFYFDGIVRQEPIEESLLNPEDNLEEFGLITGAELDFIARQVEQARRSPRGIAANIGGTGLGDIALVPAPFLKRTRGIRDVTEWYISTLTRPDYIRAVFDRQSTIAVENLRRVHARVGDAIDVIYVCGTDFGTQDTQFCSRETFDGLYAPYYRRMNSWIHDHTSWKTFKHSCGAIAPLIPGLINAGFDIINPVQLSAAGMDAAELKRTYGDKIVFWGGGVDTQKTLPFGTPEDVHRQVLSRCKTLARRGGFVFNQIHNVQPGTPIENVVAMVEAVHEYNRG